jgi:FtsH-binding integral membrane protein
MVRVSPRAAVATGHRGARIWRRTTMHRKWPIFTAGLVAALAPCAWAETSAAGNGMDSLTFWLIGIIVYLGIGAVLVVIATATNVREHRAWSALLRWEDDAEEDTNDRTGDAGRRDQAA